MLFLYKLIIFVCFHTNTYRRTCGNRFFIFQCLHCQFTSSNDKAFAEKQITAACSTDDYPNTERCALRGKRSVKTQETFPFTLPACELNECTMSDMVRGWAQYFQLDFFFFLSFLNKRSSVNNNVCYRYYSYFLGRQILITMKE